jgi:uncharacterized protein YjbI with pentapeptide repeats
MENASLNGANLRQAKLAGANLAKAVYDDRTQWDAGFDPAAAGAVVKKKKWLGLFG